MADIVKLINKRKVVDAYGVGGLYLQNGSNIAVLYQNEKGETVVESYNEVSFRKSGWFFVD